MVYTMPFLLRSETMNDFTILPHQVETCIQELIDHTFQDEGPVSYTHLAVYKRQVPDRLQFPHGAAFPDRNSQAVNGEAGGVQGVPCVCTHFQPSRKKGRGRKAPPQTIMVSYRYFTARTFEAVCGCRHNLSNRG